MATPIIMPKQGQSVETCVIIGWKKRVGDAVKTGEVVCEVETDKATFEVESPAEGTLLAIFHETGSEVPVLAPIAAVGAPGERIDGAVQPHAAPREPAPAPMTAAARVVSAPAAPAPAGPAPAAPAAQTGPTGKISESAGIPRRMASPRAKALAASHGVSLQGIRGTGPGGRIIERDVAAALAGGIAVNESAGIPRRAAGARAASPAPSAQPSAPGAVTEIKITGMRKLIAERMHASLATTAQLTLNSSADARSLQALRARFKESPEELGLRDITINDMVLFAVSRTLERNIELNAHFAENTIRRYAEVHLAFAIDTPRGLMVPVIRRAHALGLRDIAREAGRLIDGCREGGISPDELSGGTFTVSNLGNLGVESFTPVLNPPQVGILGVGSIALRPVAGVGGEVAFVPHIGLSLTINHQVVDGAPGARFLQALVEALSHFDLLLAQ
jgi:pyruvate dehydrogenase E2 component (dihydrolipoamide acetyltransferase)